jgi:hypothetical protein
MIREGFSVGKIGMTEFQLEKEVEVKMLQKVEKKAERSRNVVWNQQHDFGTNPNEPILKPLCC